jgi:hypothetical protein
VGLVYVQAMASRVDRYEPRDFSRWQLRNVEDQGSGRSTGLAVADVLELAVAPEAGALRMLIIIFLRLERRVLLTFRSSQHTPYGTFDAELSVEDCPDTCPIGRKTSGNVTRLNPNCDIPGSAAVPCTRVIFS